MVQSEVVLGWSAFILTAIGLVGGWFAKAIASAFSVGRERQISDGRFSSLDAKLDTLSAQWKTFDVQWGVLLKEHTAIQIELGRITERLSALERTSFRPWERTMKNDQTGG